MISTDTRERHGANQEVSRSSNNPASESRNEHPQLQADTLALAVAFADAACTQLATYALMTDEPTWGVVEAADLLDAARALLAEGSAL